MTSTSTPKPAPAPPPDNLPHPLTFFVTTAERARILRKLRRYSPDRTTALRAALGLRSPSASRSPSANGGGRNV